MSNEIPHSVEQSLQELQDIIEGGRSSFMNRNMVTVNPGEILDIIQDIRNNMPKQIHKAKDVISNTTKIIADANERAKTIISQAETKADYLVSEGEITRVARENADQAIKEAQADARNLRSASLNYILERVEKIEHSLTSFLTDFNSYTLDMQQYLNEQIQDVVYMKRALMEDPMNDHIDEEAYSPAAESDEGYDEEYDEEYEEHQPVPNYTEEDDYE